MWCTGDGVEVAATSAIQLKFKIGDKVRVDLDVEVLKAMQEGHGGWHPKMADVCLYASSWDCPADEIAKLASSRLLSAY